MHVLSAASAHSALAFAMLLHCTPVSAQSDAQRLKQQYQATICPLLVKFCGDCHSREDAEGELNLVDLEGWAQVKQQTDVWQKVAAMLASGQMPPKDASQPSAAESQQLHDWVHAHLKYEKSAAIAKEMLATGGSVYDLVLQKGWLTKERLDDLLSPANMTDPRQLPDS